MRLAQRAEWLVARPWRPVLLVLLVVLPLLFLGELEAADTLGRVRRDQEDALRALAQRASETITTRANALSGELTGATSIPRLAAASGYVFRRSPESPPETNTEPDLRELAFQLAAVRAVMRSNVASLFTVDGAGIVQAIDPPNGQPAAGTDVRKTEYQMALDRRVARYAGADASSSSLAVAVPLGVGSRAVATHSLVAILRPRSIESWLASLTDSVEDMYVVDQQGRVLARLNGEAMQLSSEARREPAVAAAMSGGTYLGDGHDPFTNESALVASTSVKDLDWGVMAMAKRNALQSEVDTALAQQRALRFGLSAVLLLGAAMVGMASSAAIRRRRESAEALEQQTATADVLKTISRSAFDLQAVFDVVVENATKLCRGDWGYLFRRDGDVFRIISSFGGTAELVDYERAHPTPLSRSTLIGRVALDRTVVHLPDLFEDPAYDWPSNRAAGVHTVLGVPIFKDNEVVGAIGVARNDKRPFADGEIRLVRTFADQAAIAMENVRLFNETKESLAQQTALSEVLNTISRSVFDLDAVLQTIVERAAALCDADGAVITKRVGDLAITAASFGDVVGRISVPGSTRPISDRTAVGRAVITGERQYIADARQRPDLAQDGPNTRLIIPLVRDGVAIGTLGVHRRVARPFSESELRLFDVFADQALIAIENVRLFNETKEALEQQTATAEVLKVISRSALDLQAVFDTVVKNAVRLCTADNASIYRRDGDVYRHVAVATKSGDQAEEATLHQAFTSQTAMPRGRGSAVGRVLLERRTVQIPDVGVDPEYTARQKVFPDRNTGHALIGIPISREDEILGVLLARRYVPGPYGEREIALLETFADQAAIAIENVRLFNETKQGLERQTAQAAVLRAIADSPTDVGPVLQAIAESAARFAAAEDVSVRLVNGNELTLAAHHGPLPPIGVDPFPIERDSLSGTAVLDRKTIHIVDILGPDGERFPSTRERAARGGQRAMLATPLLREGAAIGAIVLRKSTTTPFDDTQIQLIEAFASQAVIAIENVRLFDETKQALEQQTATAEVLKVISRSVLDLPAVLHTVVESAARLCDADVAWLNRVDGEARVGGPSRVGAFYGRTEELQRRADLEFSAVKPIGGVFPLLRRTLTSLAILDRRVVQVADITAEPDLQQSGFALAIGARAVVAVPLLREGAPIGALALARLTPRAFTDREIALVQTFADQAVIAIENVRLFNEIQDKSRQLEIASRHKSEFLANMSHELRTPLNAIIGFSEVLLEGIFGDVNEKQREYLKDVLGSGEHLLSLINDILDLSKIEAGRLELELSTFSVRDALESGLTIVRERAARHGIELNAVIASDIGAIEADERKVKQILYNLLSNAVKFTPDGGRVEVGIREENGDIRVEVRDTGIGVAAEDQERIFEEFRQIGRERSREGTGLGLTLTKRFVELHGGRIWLESAPGMGSTFAFTLPLRRAAAVSA